MITDRENGCRPSTMPVIIAGQAVELINVVIVNGTDIENVNLWPGSYIRALFAISRVINDSCHP